MAGSLILGSVDLMDGGAYKIHALGPDSGTSFGNPVPITEQLESFLQYGAIVVNSGWGTRDMVIAVRIKGNGASMAASAAALFAEIGKPNTLVYTAPAPGSVPQVFRVEFSQLEDTLDDLAEQKSGQRVYTIRLTCDAFTYSARLTTVPALAASGTTTTNVDNGSSATGWTAAVNGATVTPTVVSGAVRALAGSAATGLTTVTMTRTGSIATSSLKYLVVDWKAAAGAAPTGFVATGDGVALTKVASGPTSPGSAGGYIRTTFYVAAASIGVLTLALTANTTSRIPLIQSLSIDNVAVSDVRPILGTPAQQLRTIAITGSAPTIGSLALEHASQSLGDVLVYTCPDDGVGYIPACRTYKTSAGSAASDVTAVSGFYDTVTSAALNMVYGIPNLALPEGEYLIVGRMSAASPISSTLTLTAFGSMAGLPVGTSPQVVRTVALTATWTLFRLGMIHLPPTDMSEGTTSLTNISVQASASTRLDELYLFNLTTGRLTQVACDVSTAAAGGPANRLWIDSPSVDNDGRGRYLMGYSADRSDAYSAYPAAQSVGVHEFPAGSLKVFTVATNTVATTPADPTFAYYAAWSHHAAS